MNAMQNLLSRGLAIDINWRRGLSNLGERFHRSEHAAKLGEAAETADRRIAGNRRAADVGKNFVAVIGAERNGSGIAGSGSAPFFADQLLHESNDVDVA